MEYQKLETECWERATNLSHGWKRLSMHEVDLKLKNGCGSFVFGSKMSACTRFDGLGWGQLEPEDWAVWHTLREENEGVVIKKKKPILLSMTSGLSKKGNSEKAWSGETVQSTNVIVELWRDLEVEEMDPRSHVSQSEEKPVLNGIRFWYHEQWCNVEVTSTDVTLICWRDLDIEPEKSIVETRPQHSN